MAESNQPITRVTWLLVCLVAVLVVLACLAVGYTAE